MAGMQTIIIITTSWMGNSTGNTDKKSTKTGQNDKKEKNMLRQKEKSNTRKKKTLQLEEINQKVLAKEGRLKRHQLRIKQWRQNWTFQNNEKKFYHKIWGDEPKTYPQPETNEAKLFCCKIWKPREHNKKPNR